MLRKIELDERRPSKQLAALLADALELPDAERALFLRAARAELATDQLALPPAPGLPNTSPSLQRCYNARVTPHGSRLAPMPSTRPGQRGRR